MSTERTPAQRIIDSQVFDLELYRLQAGVAFDTLENAVQHYLATGRVNGLIPHPLFLPSLVAPTSWRTAKTDPLVAYLQDFTGAHTVRTHPLFDPRLLDTSPVGPTQTPLAWRLKSHADDEPLGPVAGIYSEDVTLADVRAALVAALLDLRAVHAAYQPLRTASTLPSYDPELAAAVGRLGARAEQPLVSVILPTWNRAATLGAAVASIQAQDYPHWELLVVDDGSLDDTALVVGALASRDDRIRLVRRPHSGVSAARNAGLAEASGRFVAFLDSDKAWHDTFLSTMVAFLEDGDHGAAVAGCAVHFGDQLVYRTAQATTESLRVANSVDQTAIVARRELLEQVGGFDEGLKRAVDYDLVLKLSEVTTLHQLPFIGLEYSEDATETHRISEFESKAWNHHVAERHAWDRFDRTAADLDEELVTFLVDDVASVAEAETRLEEIARLADGSPYEVVLVPHDGDWALRAGLEALTHARVPVRVLTVGFRADRPRHLNQGLRAAAGAVTVVMTGGQSLLSGRLADLLAQLTEHSAVHPVTLGPTRLIDDVGVIYPDHGADPLPLLRGLPVDVVHTVDPYAVPAATFPLVARTEDLWAVQGATALLDSLWVDVDLSQKLARHRGAAPAVNTHVVAQNTAPPWPARGGADDVRTFRQLWPTPPTGSATAQADLGVTSVITGFTALSYPDEPDRWTRAVYAPGPFTVRDREAPLLFSIRTAAPADDRSVNWGDYHYAQSLASALRGLGQRAHVDYQPNADRDTSGFEDVMVSLRGLRDVPVPGNATSVLWVISHPELVGVKEAEKYDLVYAASVPWAQRFTEQWGVDVQPLLQCTDPSRFHPDVPLLPELSGSIVMVGNSRKQFRPAAWHTANAGLPVRIWGTDWEGMVPPECLMGPSIPNEELASYYRSARWNLNDHWPEMREEGFISNRIFDVLAAGGRLVTDDVAGLGEVFGDRLQVFADPRHLLELVDQDPAAAYPSSLLEELSSQVRAEHTFEARATRLLHDVQQVRRARHQGEQE